MSAYDSFLLRIIDKTNSTPTGITEGGLVAGDISGFFVRAELLHSIINKTTNVTIMLYIPESGIFATAAPKLLDDDAQDKYYLEAQIEQDGTFTRVFRLRIGQPTLMHEDGVGEMMKIPVIGIEYIAREWPTSKNEEFLGAKQRFINLLTEYNANGGVHPGGTNPILNQGTIDLPDDPRLNWRPFAPRMLEKALKEIIEQQVEAGPVGGVFKDKYVDYKANATTTKQVDVDVLELGGISTGITINSETTTIPATPEKKTAVADQLTRKNIVLYKFHPAGSSLPMEKTRFESDLNHAKVRDEWDAAKAYAVGDIVKYTHTPSTPLPVAAGSKHVLRFFTAINVSGPTAVTPDANTADWTEDFTIIPPHSVDAFYLKDAVVYVVAAGNVTHFQADADIGPGASPPLAGWTARFTVRADTNHKDFVTNSPYTNDLDVVKKTALDGQDNLEAGYVGAVRDWNGEVPLYDRVDYSNDFNHVSGRNCRGQQNAPPTGNLLFHGSRWLVGAAGSGAWAGQSNKIATYNRLPVEDIANPQWLFSDAPVEGDTIMLDNMAQVLAFQSGTWTVKHDIATNNDKSGPYHLCTSIRLVEDKSGIPGQAVELDFDWELAAEGGDDRNRTSRGFWYYEELPLPSRDSANHDIGGLYGGQGGGSFPPLPFLSSINLNFSRRGLVGWNRGLESEDMGRLGVHVIAINVGFFRSEVGDDTILTKGVANIPVLYWRKDLFGRVYFHQFTIPRNAEWWIERVPIPPIGPPTQLYHNRLDELGSIFGYTFPTLFGLPEKEFSGIRFDERFAKGWGVQYGEVYSKEGFYTGTYNYIIRTIQESFMQFIPDAIETIDKIAHGDFANLGFLGANTNTQHVKLKIGNLYYEKEGYALSQDVKLNEPRFHIERDEAERDYNNAKVKAKAIELRKFEVIHDWHFTAAGDTRMEAGKTFLLDGPNIPNAPLTLFCLEVKHIIDNDQGYDMEIYAIEKREVPI